ncbi:hypothetical protein SAMN04488077_11137 [Roseovarius tolerans]|uniref:Uncharacterized protein n=1 Tax=Roseovarius tolerans TaxID=74031 RepID=A0A1H8D833_9RHOB|nr:hypothetical protein [Roseovarius tolerans]SEN03453.1 hypothetical protein SAMN04488077_11137 [Roseovarius tolerans]
MLNTIIRSQRFFTTAILSIVLLSGATVSNAETTEAKIARAISAAPSDITNEATIMDVDGTILRSGINRWVCIPGVGLIPGDKHPMCNDPVWMKWMAAMALGTEFTTDVIGVAYMMAGDPWLNVDNPMATDPNDGGVWRQEGAHVMLLFPDMDVLADLPPGPVAGGPYVMWGGTPMEHVILPIDAKDLQK